MNGRQILTTICTASFFLITAGCNNSVVSDVEMLPPISDQSTPAITPYNEQTKAMESTTPDKKTLIIYDDDGSRDGMAALLYLLSIPEISIEAVNISYGEAHPEQYIQLVGRALEDVGIQNIPLGAGQDAPLAGGTPFPDWLRQLGENFWDYSLPNIDKEYPFQYAPELMVSTINNRAEPVTIFLSGPFTNLAQALRIDPVIKENIAAVYFMGGAVYGPGNITNLIPDSSNKVAEWNIIADPQAAKEVFMAGLEMYMIPLDATNQVIHIQEEILPWHGGDEKAIFSADLYDIMFDDYGLKSVEIFDQTAAVIMVRPDLCAFEFLALDVVTEDGDTQGQTIVDPNGNPNIHVCLEPDVAQVKLHLDAIYSNTQIKPDIPPIDSIAGTWTGSAWNNDFELQVTITIEETCQLGEMCGKFDIANASCAGTFTWVGMDGELYQFEAGDKTDGCGDGIDYLALQADGTLRYLSRGDYGETEGFLQREP